LSIAIAGVSVLRRGAPASETAIRRAARAMRTSAFTIAVDLGSGGKAEATVTTSDLSPAYVRFNSAYST
jgi:N-acetylglutamate synthase/N-acetylornithine aminotransferase